MNCELFQTKIRDFVFDKIEYSEDLEEFLLHAKECDNCMEELELYYTIHRGLEDIEPPVETDMTMTVEEELDYIFEYYFDYFRKEKHLYKIIKIVIIAFIVIVPLVLFYLGFIS